MSRQSKAAKRKIIAATFTALHKQGQKGPSRTQATHGKVKTFKYLEAQKRAADLAKEAAQAERAAANAKEAAKKPQGKNKPSGKPPGAKAPAKPQAKPAHKVAAGTIGK